MDREKVMTWLEICGKNNDCSGCCPYSENGFGEYGRCRESLMADAYALLKEQEGIIKELLDLGYPHNFQHEAPWVVDYLYKLTEIIKKAFKAREGR